MANQNFKGPLLKPHQRGKGSAIRETSGRKSARPSRYEVLKTQIRTWWEDRFKIGEALAEIREKKFYLEEHATFEQFCMAEFDLSHSQVYRLIEAAQVKASVAVSPIGGSLTNERQARALAVVPEKKRVAVLTRVAKAGSVTARAITEAIQPRVKPVKKAATVQKQCPLCKGLGVIDS